MVLLLGAAPALSAKKIPAPPQFTLNVAESGNPYMPVQVKNATLNVRIALSFDMALILNAQPAARAGLKPFPLIGKRTFRNAMIPGGEATFRFNLATIVPQGLPSKKVPAVWVSKPIADDADGVLTVGALQADRIEVRLRPTPEGSKVYTLAKKGKGETGLEARVGEEEIDVSFELNTPATVMNARAAQALVDARIVRRANAIGYWRPFPGVALPWQQLTPMPGATLLGLPLRTMGARVSEAEARRIDAEARAGTSTSDDDADTITVTADRRKKGRDPWIIIGRDVLDDCSRILFDRPGKRWQLTCKFE